MDNQYYFSCVNCNGKLELTNDNVFLLDDGGVLTCECGVFLCPDDIRYDEAKKLIKDRKKTEYVIYSLSAICVLLAFVFKAPALLPIIVIIAGAIIRSLNSGEIIELTTKLSPQNASPSRKFTSIKDFKVTSKRFRFGFSKVVNKCCVCENLTKQTVNDLPICASCSKDL
ncbi:hypothetical protein [Vibrio metoecus]|uniref:hypothetical protein n=1 Tax=Vibrio metoecus TaxID=1481663 RepID=UPI000BA90311|nr:hypothetical protein [Vibrio metoecus]EJK2994615.1 hypothetical protein [Vibrio cholerae]EJL6905590.1 hypothetical protein [Vibrio cholerae]ELL0578864.1 hypothetical protein [Vibrio cholerae]PAR26423.1 hypothetical protein CGU00_18780 [Vibrio metoecus]PAR27691.1 hypothetical protein CGT99_18100 [Vibrio metoecus]